MKSSASIGHEDRPEPRTTGILGATLGSLALFALSTWVPVLGLLAMASPFPLLVLRVVGGRGQAWGATCVVCASLGVVFSPGQALFFLFFFAIPGLLVSEAVAQGRGLRRGCVRGFLWLACEIGLALLFAGAQMAARVLEPLDAFRSPEFLGEMRSSGLPPERVADWADELATLHRAMGIVYPAVYVILGAVVVLVNAALLRTYLARRDPGWLEGGEFERLRWPFAFAPIFVLSGAAILSPLLRSGAYNALLVLGFLFTLQGLAVVAFYAHRLAGPPLLRGAVLVLVLVNPWAPQILALLGLFDLWFNFRKWAEPPQTRPA